jgi:hypothetical protein
MAHKRSLASRPKQKVSKATSPTAEEMNKMYGEAHPYPNLTGASVEAADKAFRKARATRRRNPIKP